MQKKDYFNRSWTQKDFWDGEKIKKLIEVWPKYVKGQKERNLSMGDLMIKSVVDFYAKIGSEVVIITGDQGLRIHKDVDIKAVKVPRRRSK